MMYTGGGLIVFLVWLLVVTGGYYVITAFEVSPWISLASACVLAAIVTYAIGRSLNGDTGDHKVNGIPAQWVGIAAPIFFGLLFGVAELLRAR